MSLGQECTLWHIHTWHKYLLCFFTTSKQNYSNKSADQFFSSYDNDIWCSILAKVLDCTKSLENPYMASSPLFFNFNTIFCYPFLQFVIQYLPCFMKKEETKIWKEICKNILRKKVKLICITTAIHVLNIECIIICVVVGLIYVHIRNWDLFLDNTNAYIAGQNKSLGCFLTCNYHQLLLEIL